MAQLRHLDLVFGIESHFALGLVMQKQAHPYSGMSRVFTME